VPGLKRRPTSRAALASVVSHSCRKNKHVARVGHPVFGRMAFQRGFAADTM
jgi:hypothetical protein